MTTPYYQDSHIRIYQGDCRSMSELEDESIQCVITSPPYWGLRKYSGEQDLIWGDNHCEHRWEDLIPPRGSINWASFNDYHKEGQVMGGGKRNTIGDSQTAGHGNFCSLCGAWKGAFGLEPTPEMYVQHTIEILREIRRVLRKDGVVFWNIGDSYASSPPGNKPNTTALSSGLPNSIANQEMRRSAQAHKRDYGNLKPKDLCLIPFRIAIAAQEDGWWVRSVIIWAKPNPMPESVTDRPTESHEYILLLTKSKNYYWDADAVREPHLPATIERYKYGYKESERDKLGHSHHGKGYQRNGGSPIELNAGRNLRTVWEFPTQPYPEAHFAVFPEKLPELCIKAATPEVGCCSKCGKPWERIRENIGKVKQGWEVQTKIPPESGGHTGLKTKMINQYETLGWQPSCNCNADKVPSVVLDNFMGTGTTLWVAKKLGRRAVGYDISEEYCRLALERNRQMVLTL